MPNQMNQSPIDLRTAAQIWNDNLGLRDQLSGKQLQDTAANNTEISWTDPLKAAGGSALTSLGGGIKNLSLGDLVRAVRNVPETAGNLASSVAEQANDELVGNPFMKNMGLKPQDVHRVYTKDNPIEKAGDAVAESVPVQVLGDALHNVGEAVQRGADIADKVVKPVSRTVGGAIDSAGDNIHERISPDGQKALQSQMVSEDKDGFHPGDAWSDPGKLAMKFSDAIGSIGGVVGSSMLTGGTVRQMVTRTMLRRGASESVAREIADKTAQHWAANAAMAAGITMSTGQSAEQVQDAYETVSDEDKLNSPIFKDTVRAVYQQHPDWTPQQRMEVVDQQMKEKLASTALSDPKTYAAAAAGTMLGDAMLAKMVIGGGSAFTGNLVTRMGKGMLKGASGEAVGEGTEQAIQQYVQNNVMNDVAGTHIDPMQDVVRGGMEAGILGGLTGGAMGSAGGIHKAPAGQTEPVTETSGEFAGQPVQPKPDDQIPDIADAMREVSANPVPGSFSIGKDGDSYRGIFVNPDGKSAFTKPYSSPQQVKDALHPYLANSQNSAEPQSRDVQLDEPAYLRTGNIPEELQQTKADQPIDDVRRSEPEGILQPLQPVVTGNPDEPAFLRTRSANPTGRDLSGQPDANPYSDIQQQLARQQSAPTADQLVAESMARGDQGKTPQEDFVVGDYLPKQAPAQLKSDLSAGVTVDGDGREVIPESNQLTHNGVINVSGETGDSANSEYVPPVTQDRVSADQSLGQETIRDPRTPVGQSILQAGQQHDAIFDQLTSLRVTRKGKPFRTEKEAQLASRSTETPIALPEGGFGVADKSELAQIKTGQPLTGPASNTVEKTEMADLTSENKSDQKSDDIHDQDDINKGKSRKNNGLKTKSLDSDLSENRPVDSAVSKLRKSAEDIIAKAQQEQNRDRQTNTPKRVREAASAIRAASRREALGHTINNLADALERGQIKHLSQVTSKAQVEEMELVARNAVYEANRLQPYSETREQREPELDDVKFAKMPQTVVFSERLDRAIEKLGKASETNPKLLQALKRIQQKQKNNDRDIHLTSKEVDVIEQAHKQLSANGDRYDLNYTVEQNARVKRLNRIGINNQTDLRNALKEYLEVRNGVKEEDPIKVAERELVGKKVGVDFFPTPIRLAERMAKLAGIRSGMKVLEPSAGNGHLADAARTAGGDVDTYEVSPSLQHILGLKGHRLAGSDFTERTDKPEYDAVLMNPPFSNRLDAEHIQKAYAQLKPGGKLVAIAGEGVFFGSDKKATAFRTWLDERNAEVEKLPEKTFLDKQLPTTTGVNARLIVIDKPAESPKNSQFSSVRKVTNPMRPKEIELVAKGWLNHFKTNLKVIAVTNQEELGRVLEANGYDGTIDSGTIVGASFMPRTDTLVLNAETIGSVKEVQRLMRHEAMVHYGLTHFAGPDTFSQVFNAIMDGYVTSPEIKATFDHVIQNYPQANLLTKMEEVFAHYAEHRPLDGGPVARLWQKVKDIVRWALIKAGFIKPNAAEEELDDVLRDIAANMRAGRQDGGPDSEATPTQSSADSNKFKQSDDISDVLDSAFTKLGLKPKSGIVTRTKNNLGKLRDADRKQVGGWIRHLLHKANTEMLDELAPIKYAEDATGKPLDASESGYIAARMSRGSSTVMNATMLYGLPEWHEGVIRRKAGTGEADAMLGIFSGLGKDLNHWLMWMAGHRAENLMAEGRENLFTPDEIEAMKGLNLGKEKQFEDARQQWKALNKAVLDLAQEAGLIEPGIRDQWESEWYVPFYRDNDDGDVMAPYRKRGIANQSSGIRKLKGGTANVHDLLENIFNSTSRLIDASMKNMATLRTIHNLAGTELITINDKPNLMDLRSLKNPKSQMFSVKMDGKDVLVTVHDPELFNAMTMISHVSQPNTFVRMGMFAKHLLTAGITIDPGFMFRNFIRDAASAWTMNKDGFKPVIDSARGVLKSWKMDPAAVDMMFAGATFQGGNLRGNDPGVMAASVRKALRAKGLSPDQINEYQNSLITSVKAAKAKLGHYLEQYEKMGESVENGSRVAIYEAALKAGKSKAQAAFEARDLMDFSMGGASGTIKFLISVLPFFNARLQGLGKLGRAFQNNPKQIAMRGGMIAAASLALLAVNWDDKRYNQLPDWDRDNNWHFWMGDQHFRIPKPFELGLLFGTLPERMIRTVGGIDTTGKLGREIGSNIWSTIEVNPIPQVVRPLMEAYLMNTNTFTWSPIETMSDQNMEPRARYNEQTSLTMRGIGESLNLSPKKLEYIWRGYTGTVGAYVMALSDAIIRHTGDYGETPNVRADQIPILNSIYQGSAPARNTQDMQDFYDLLDDALKARQTFRNYLKDGERDKAREMLGDPEEKANIQKSTALNQVQQSFRTMRNQIEMIRRDKLLKGDQKTERINRILAQRNDLAAKLVKRFGPLD